MAKFTVISTSGYQGDGWSVRKYTDSRKEAQSYAKEIASSDAKSNTYITAVIGETHACVDHGEFCVIGDTSRVHTSERHLKSRHCHINESSLY